jgi:glyoxylase-like metal-dependent hydrolase (beta-lactamase superfamily II)
VVIDPGPADATHLDALAAAVEDAEHARIVLTHGHRDHAPAALALAERTGLEVWGPAGLPLVDHPIVHGDVVPTDEGDLVAVETPGHARHHLAFHWPDRRALFVGDLLLGRGATTWVGEYSGCVADYLSSLDRVRALDLGVIYPAHGPALEDPVDAVARFEAHRRERIQQMEEALAAQPDATEIDMLSVVYGAGVPQAMLEAALLSVRALMEHVGYPRS